MSDKTGASAWFYVAAHYLSKELFTPIAEAGPDINSYVFSMSGIWIWILLALFCCCLPYALFQKHLLPHKAGMLVGRCYFWPCIPCTIYGNKVEFKGQWMCYVDDESPSVLLGQAPLFDSQLKELEHLNARAIINLCDEFKGPARYYKRKKIDLLWLKTVDHKEPTVEAMHTACSFIEHMRSKGSGVYIHCKSGRGRSAAIAMAWLMKARKMSPRQAQDHLLAQRKVRSKLYLQKNVIQFYTEMQQQQAEMAQADLEMGGRGRAISFATTKRAHRASAASRATLVQHEQRGPGGKRDRRNPLTAPLAEDYAIDERPPDWGDSAGGLWEINVAPLEAAFAQEGAYDSQREGYATEGPYVSPQPHRSQQPQQPQRARKGSVSRAAAAAFAAPFGRKPPAPQSNERNDNKFVSTAL